MKKDQKPKRKWCNHIRSIEGNGFKSFWIIKMFAIFMKLKVNCRVPDSWEVCPICGAERPTQQNIKAAAMRAELDGVE